MNLSTGADADEFFGGCEPEFARQLKRSASTWRLLETGGQRETAPLGMVQLVAQRLDAPTHHLRLGFLMARRHWAADSCARPSLPSSPRPSPRSGGRRHESRVMPESEAGGAILLPVRVCCKEIVPRCSIRTAIPVSRIDALSSHQGSS
jgi:hypothetical protein